MEEISGGVAGRLRRIGAAVIIALVFSCLLIALEDSEGVTLLWKGDFPGFFAPARIIVSGQGERLYDLHLQSSIENSVWPSEGELFYRFAYPPHFALLLAPLGYLSPASGKVVLTLLMVVALLTSVIAGRKVVPLFGREPLFGIAYLLAIFPILVSVLSTQNTALSIALLIGAVALLDRRTRGADFFSGLLAGALLFKPQYGVPALIAWSATARPWVLWGLLLSSIVAWCGGAMVLGINWVVQWIKVVLEFGEMNLSVNGRQMISLWGMFQTLLPRALLASLSCLVLLPAIISFWRARRGGISELRPGFALLLVGIVLSAQQTLFYDFGIAFVGFLSLMPARSYRDLAIIVSFGGVASLLQYYHTATSINLLGLFTLALYLMALYLSYFRKSVQDICCS